MYGATAVQIPRSLRSLGMTSCMTTQFSTFHPATQQMPKNAATSNTAPSSIEAIRDSADQLYRAAEECCRQHERCARLTRGEVDEAELRGMLETVALCDRLLAEATAAYERTATLEHPDDDSEQWWRKANALWLAGREYGRRHLDSNHAARGLAGGGRKSPEKLGELQMDYELEASALLALKHAVDAYRKVRPGTP